VLHVAVRASQDFERIRNYDHDKSLCYADPYCLNCLSFFMEEVGKIRCSTPPRLSAIITYFRESVVCVCSLHSDAFSTTWSYRVSIEKLKVNDLVDLESLEEESAEVRMCGEWIRTRKEEVILINSFIFVGNCVRMMESWKMRHKYTKIFSL
jgi:hypothetical protein